jgi:hypothetical protein
VRIRMMMMIMLIMMIYNILVMMIHDNNDKIIYIDADHVYLMMSFNKMN